MEPGNQVEAGIFRFAVQDDFFTVSIHGTEFGRVPNNTIEGEPGSKIFMLNGIARFLTKYGALLDISRASQPEAPRTKATTNYKIK